MTGLPNDVDVYDLIDPARYAQRGYPHDAWTTLRNHDPVAYFHAEGWKPFWAITKHADVLEIAKQPLKFSSAQGITLLREGIVIPPSEILVLLDPPKHGPVRRVANGRFTPKAVREQRADIERIAGETIAAASGTELDFVDRIAAPFPLGVIAWILGVPSDQWANLFRWTNEVIGKDDPEYRREGESPGKTIKRARGEVHAYFRELIAERRADPQEDLVSELLRGEVDGKELNEEQLVSYCELLVEAGNETTRNAISGGLLACSENPGAWERLGAEPALLPDAVEEILRWVSPISHFTRVATEDYELRGKTIKAGDQVALYFASANRDEEVFDDPFAFRIDRKPNPHITFGFGEHFCMGAHVARVEVETIFRHLLARMQSFEVTGTVERLSSITNGSIKHLPITLTTSPSGTNGDDS
ncbi:MAG TPA: cytochrome P450 [Acidimicrobiia bacterium]|nr:cytochrome P450 [Acidimicrobiia bacterium]